jgi:hypothetical protein
MVIPMNPKWMNKYNIRQEFLSFFENEQDYVDAMFTQIVMFNFGEFIDASMMLTDQELVCARELADREEDG